MVEYKDRHTWLVVFGVMELLLAGMCLLGLLFAAMGMAMSVSQGAMPVRFILPGLTFYLLAAAFFATMGVGSIMARRWARTLLHIVSILWLITGMLATAALCVMMPKILAGMTTGQEAQMAKVMTITMIATSLSMIPFYIGLPLVLFLFYRSPSVKATCEARDPRVRWTDRCPMPVLALSVILAYGALSLVASAPLAILPGFGRLLTGPPAALLLLVLAGVMGWLAYGTYRRQPAAWWACLVLIAAGTVSGTMTFMNIDMMDMLKAMGMDESQLAMPYMLDMDAWMTWQIAVSGLVFLGFVLYLGRYFKTREETRPPLPL